MGESGFPVAAAERGRKVILRAGTIFEVGDHDFMKFSIVPSVTLVVNIPDNIHDSCYRVTEVRFWLAIKMRHLKLRPP